METTILENQMEKKMGNEMETGIIGIKISEIITPHGFLIKVYCSGTVLNYQRDPYVPS